MASAAGAALLRRAASVQPLPPKGTRGKYLAEQLGLGRSRIAGGFNPQSGTQRSSNTGGQYAGDRSGGTQDMPKHYQALSRMSEQLSAPLSDVFGTSGPMQALRDRQARIRKISDQKKSEEVFEQARQFLMEPITWTYGNMLGYQRKVLELAGATGWRRKISADDPSIVHLEKELKVLQAMTPVELMSNHKDVFTNDSKKLIAEKSGTTVQYVTNVIMEHDILRADRRWYQILEQFRKPLPQSFEDRQFMAEFDRPFSESELEYQQTMIDEHVEKQKRVSPPRLKCTYYRQPTCGGNRWSTRTPKWYPVQWRMRPDRRSRLQGVGRSGGGGDRGIPYGRLGQHFKGGPPVPL